MLWWTSGYIQFCFPQGICLEWIARSYGGFIPSFFKESPYCLPWWLYKLTFSPTMKEGSLFTACSPAFILCRFFDGGHSEDCEEIPHCSFDLHFSNHKWHQASFHVFISHLYVFIGKMSESFFPFFWFVCLFSWYWLVWAACIFWKLILCQLFHLLLFSPILRFVCSPSL